MNVVGFSEALFNGLSIGSILVLTALGLGITFGVMRVINMAHGDMLMLGAYTAFLFEEPSALPKLLRNLTRLVQGLTTTFGLSSESAQHLADALQPARDSQGFELGFFWVLPIAFLVTAFIGYLLEIGLIRFLYGRPLDTLLATWGVSLILQQLVLLLFGADLVPVPTPEYLNRHWQIGQVAVPIYRVFVVGFTAACLAGVYLLFHKTTLGLQLRAVTQNRPMAAALGISTRRVDAFAFAFASGLAGVAGCILGHLYTVKYTMGGDYIIQAFMVVILGGMGSLGGTIAGGLIVGMGQSFLEKFLGSDTFKTLLGYVFGADAARHFLGNPSALGKISILLVVVGFLLARPSGLFAAKERSYD